MHLLCINLLFIQPHDISNQASDDGVAVPGVNNNGEYKKKKNTKKSPVLDRQKVNVVQYLTVKFDTVWLCQEGLAL